ncbi:MAG: cysteine desulfurase family protein [Candidatus Jorgensenbacteria bacterium]
MKKSKPVYLDYAASTPLRAEAARAMRAAECVFGNPSSLHSFGQAARTVMDKAREKTAAAIGADFREVIFTGSATEANNLALRGVVKAYQRKSAAGIGVNQRPKLIVSAIEHESVLTTARDLERSGDAEIVIIPVNRHGIADIKTLENALDERTALVSVMYVNNETGTVQPIAEISKIIRNYKLQTTNYPLFHIDASQALAYFDCDVNKLGVDLMTLSGHKIGGPRGVGVLFVKNQKSNIKNQNFGNDFIVPVLAGGDQEFGLRAGTENAAAIAGFAEAATLAVRERAKNSAHAAHCKELFLKELKRARVKFTENVPRGGASPHILNLRFPGLAAEELLVRLDLAGVAVSAGSACTARAVLPSHVLLAMGMPKREVEESIRISFGIATAAAEIREAAKRFAGAVQEMKETRG